MANDRPAPALERIERAAARLRPIEREVLVLAAREGLSTAEIAARLWITPDGAGRLLARALANLDRALERQGQRWWRRWRFW